MYQSHLKLLCTALKNSVIHLRIFSTGDCKSSISIFRSIYLSCFGGSNGSAQVKANDRGVMVIHLAQTSSNYAVRQSKVQQEFYQCYLYCRTELLGPNESR